MMRLRRYRTLQPPDEGRLVLLNSCNFDGYDPIRISEAPPIEVHIVASREEPGGMGEPGVPPIAPAVANAIFAASGRRRRRLPLDLNLGA